MKGAKVYCDPLYMSKKQCDAEMCHSLPENQITLIHENGEKEELLLCSDCLEKVKKKQNNGTGNSPPVKN